jgi:hypothetical protein
MRRLLAIFLVLLATASQAEVITGAMILQLPVGAILQAGQWIFSGGEKTYYIEVLGVGKTPEEARLNGFRLAVEQAVGSIIASETEVVNNRIARDEVISYASGYVSKYEILWQGQDNVYGYKTQLKVWIKRSIIANRLLHESKVAGDLEGAKASVSLSTIQYERSQGDRLVGVVLNDFYRRAMDIELKPAQVKLDNNRNGILTIPFRLSWNKDYLNSLYEAYKTTAQTSRNGCWYNCANTSVSTVDISGTKLGFTDSTKTMALIQTMILSEPRIELTVLTEQDQVMHKQCFRWAALDHIDDYNQSSYFVDVSKTNIANVRVNTQAYMDTAIQLKTTPKTLEQASKTQLKLVPKNQCSA